MKKTSSLLIIILIAFASFTQSCSTDNEILKNNQNIENNAERIKGEIILPPDPLCKIKGPECANPGDEIVYYVDTEGSGWDVTVDGSDMAVYPNGNGSVIIVFGSDFDGGVLTLTNKSIDCSFNFPIDLCDTTPINCDLTGPDCGRPGQNITLNYSTSSSSNPSVSWTIENGDIMIVSGAGTNEAVFHLGTNFNGGSITATYSSGSEICSRTITIPKCATSNSCSYPYPVIDDRVCVSGGHPHWRFKVNGVSASDDITWSINHGDVLVGANSDYAIIRPNAGSTAGFTVYCNVVRTCSDGSTKERTAFYTNYYGNECGTGTTGFTDSIGNVIPD